MQTEDPDVPCDLPKAEAIGRRSAAYSIATFRSPTLETRFKSKPPLVFGMTPIEAGVLAVRMACRVKMRQTGSCRRSMITFHVSSTSLAPHGRSTISPSKRCEVLNRLVSWRIQALADRAAKIGIG